MRKAHFCAVDSAIACALDDGENVVIFRVEGNLLRDSLDGSSMSVLYVSHFECRTFMCRMMASA